MKPLSSRVISRSRFLLGALLLPFLPLVRRAEHVQADDCSCVTYVRNTLASRGITLDGGIAHAGDYQESWMTTHHWHRVKPLDTPSDNKILADGGVMVWDPNQKGAYGDGHMGIVDGNPFYRYNDPTKPLGGGTWVINVWHADWPVGQNCGGTRQTFTGWGDLYGINFYSPD